MDYVFLDALKGRKLKRLTGVYDVWCKYCKNLDLRVNNFPDDMTCDFKVMSKRGYVPKFHLPAHGPECRTIYSLNYAEGVGRGDGEGQERVWALQGRVAVQTAEMNPGHRLEVLNDNIAHQNFARFLGLREYCALSYV
jgi:hypothetical protein